MPNPIPQHVAIIMDGNGRWAKKQGLLRVQGHEVGAQRAEEIIQAAQDKGIRFLTLYAFSKENWRRPKEEVEFLMGLLSSYLDKKIETLIKNNCVFNVIGETGDLAPTLQKKLKQAVETSKAWGFGRRHAECNSAIRQITNLRYITAFAAVGTWPSVERPKSPSDGRPTPA